MIRASMGSHVILPSWLLSVSPYPHPHGHTCDTWRHMDRNDEHTQCSKHTPNIYSPRPIQPATATMGRRSNGSWTDSSARQPGSPERKPQARQALSQRRSRRLRRRQLPNGVAASRPSTQPTNYCEPMLPALAAAGGRDGIGECAARTRCRLEARARSPCHAAAVAFEGAGRDGRSMTLLGRRSRWSESPPVR